MTEEDLYRERLQLALEAAELDLWENNLTTGEVTKRVSRVFADLGYTNQESLAFVDDLYGLIHPDDVPLVKQAVADHMAGLTAQYRCEFRLRAHDGSWVWYGNYGKIMDVGEGRCGKRFIGVTFNINDRKRREEELAELNRQLAEQNAVLQTLATTDSLTELANRRLLFEAGEKECLRGARFDQPVSLLVFDLDYFKRVNDSWGHPAGDEVLRAVADLCRGHFRQGTDVVARIGGEEFAILMPATDHDEALNVAERLRHAVAVLRVDVGGGAVVSCTASIGVTTLSGARLESAKFNRLFVDADRALYRAKDAGRNRVMGIDADARNATSNVGKDGMRPSGG
ncbi:MAG TPA: sensor domain-containing diguanylate cyclase [Rhodocyclaceae bacterium]|nr:sensor domain-containing diguanylate cyclase [Rhodocyclaceae bacterium]